MSIFYVVFLLLGEAHFSDYVQYMDIINQNMKMHIKRSHYFTVHRNAVSLNEVCREPECINQ